MGILQERVEVPALTERYSREEAITRVVELERIYHDKRYSARNRLGAHERAMKFVEAFGITGGEVMEAQRTK